MILEEIFMWCRRQGEFGFMLEALIVVWLLMLGVLLPIVVVFGIIILVSAHAPA